MSSTALWEVYKTTAHVIAEYRNSHGSGPPIWAIMGTRYLGWDSPYRWEDNNLWGLYKKQEIPLQWRFALLLTCDGALIPAKKEYLEQAAGWCELVGKELEVDAIWGTSKVNHWAAIGKDIRNYKPKARVIGLGLGCTSVCDPWENWPKGEISEYFDLFEELNKSPLAEALATNAG